MKYVQAFLSLGLFSFLGFVLLDEEALDDGGSSRSRALKSALASVSDAMGAETAAAVSFGAGIVLSLFFMLRR